MLRSGAADAPLQSEYGNEDVEEVDGLAADGDVRGSKSHVPIIIRMPGLIQSDRQRRRAWQFFRSKQESHAAIVRGVQAWCRQTPAYRSKAATVLSTARMPRSNSSGSGSRETARYPSVLYDARIAGFYAPIRRFP